MGATTGVAAEVERTFGCTDRLEGSNMTGNGVIGATLSATSVFSTCVASLTLIDCLSGLAAFASDLIAGVACGSLCFASSSSDIHCFCSYGLVCFPSVGDWNPNGAPAVSLPAAAHAPSTPVGCVGQRGTLCDGRLHEAFALHDRV